jgi:GTP pyrophosphokinase
VTDADTVFPYKNIPLQKIIAREDEIEDAVEFFVQVMNGPFKRSTKKGKKPVVMHSLRVGFWLMIRGYPAPVIIAGLLHDLLEQTNISAGALARRFGEDVAAMVLANTIVKSTKLARGDARPDVEQLARYRDSVRRCAACGAGAMQVRAADLMDNCERQLALGNLERLQKIYMKLEILKESFKATKVDNHLLAELEMRVSQLKELIY